MYVRPDVGTTSGQRLDLPCVPRTHRGDGVREPDHHYRYRYRAEPQERQQHVLYRTSGSRHVGWTPGRSVHDGMLYYAR